MASDAHGHAEKVEHSRVISYESHIIKGGSNYTNTAAISCAPLRQEILPVFARESLA